MFRPNRSGSSIVSRERVREAIRAKFDIAEDVTISVTELHCNEPGCPPVETAIAIMRSDLAVETYKIHKAVAAIAQSDIDSLGDHDHGNVRS